MTIHLELENGLIKKYHLDCAIYAAEYTAKDNKKFFKLYIFISAFWFAMAIFNQGLGLVLGGICTLFGIYNIWQSDKAAKKSRRTYRIQKLWKNQWS